jgi:predicted ATPase
MSIAHSVLWLCAALTDAGAPLVLVVDDAHWADRPSLEVLSYLARRIADLPVLLVVAFRPDVPDAPYDLLTLITDCHRTGALSLAPLTADGSATLVRRLVPDTSLEVCRRCHDAAHGNPWLVAELAHQVSIQGVGSLSFPPDSETAVRTVASSVAVWPH